MVRIVFLELLVSAVVSIAPLATNTAAAQTAANGTGRTYNLAGPMNQHQLRTVLAAAPRGASITEKDATRIETRIARGGGDFADRVKLVVYYAAKANPDVDVGRGRLLSHILWIVHNRPDSVVAESDRCMPDVGDVEAIEQLRTAWCEEAKTHPADRAVLRNAATFLTSYGLPEALEVWKGLHVLVPNNRRVEKSLADAYLSAALGGAASTQRSLAEHALQSYIACDKHAVGAHTHADLCGSIIESAIMSGRYDVARQYAEKCIRYPKTGSFNAPRFIAATALGQLALYAGNRRLAVRYLKQSERELPGLVDYDLAIALIRCGERSSVLDFLKATGATNTQAADFIEQFRSGFAGGYYQSFQLCR